jgi:hypothetical protein
MRYLHSVIRVPQTRVEIIDDQVTPIVIVIMCDSVQSLDEDRAKLPTKLELIQAMDQRSPEPPNLDRRKR